MFERLRQSNMMMFKRVEIYKAIMMLLTEIKEDIMLRMVMLFPSKKVMVGVLFMFQLTKVLMYMMVMHKTEDRTDQEGLPNPTLNTAQRFMI